MTSKNFSFKSLMRHNMVSRMWAIALGVLGCLGGLLLPVFVIQQNYKEELKWIGEGYTSRTAAEALDSAQRQIAAIVSFQSPFIKLVLIVLATLCGVAMFRYLHDRRQVDFYHALPMNRGKLFALNYVTGVLLVIPIYLIVLVIALACVGAMGLGGQLSAFILVQSVLGNIAYFLLNYTVAVLCTALTGNTIITVLLGIWMQLGIPMLMIMVQCYQTMFYETFGSGIPVMQSLILYGSPMCNYLVTTDMSHLVTVPLFSDGSIQTAGGMGILIYPVILTILLGVLSYVLFVRRKSENTGMAISFGPFKAPLKWFMCIVSGFAFSLIFTAMFNRTDGWMWFGLIFGVVLCHMVVEIIYDFDFKSLLHHWKQMIVLAVVAVVLVVGVKNDVFGYDNYVPKLDNIASVAVDSPYYGTDYNYFQPNEPKYQLSDAQSIELVHEIAELSVANNTGSQDENDLCQSYTIYYTLKNGNREYRQYYNVPQSVVQDQMIQLVTSEPYLKRYSTVQNVTLPQSNDEGTIRLEVRNSLAPDALLPQATLISRNEVQEVIDQLRADQLAHAKEHLSEIPVIKLDLFSDWKDGQKEDVVYNAQWSVFASDTDTLALIKRLTGIEPAVLSHENVQSIEITKYTSEEYEEFMQTYVGYREDVFMDEHTVTVTDPATIDQLLESAVTQSMAANSGFLTQTESFSDNLTISAKLYVQSGDNSWTSTEESLYYPQGKAPLGLIEQLTQGE